MSHVRAVLLVAVCKKLIVCLLSTMMWSYLKHMYGIIKT